eukprot:Ihof_evm2s803 gene=Ihof_evmTU2s803
MASKPEKAHQWEQRQSERSQVVVSPPVMKVSSPLTSPVLPRASSFPWSANEKMVLPESVPEESSSSSSQASPILQGSPVLRVGSPSIPRHSIDKDSAKPNLANDKYGTTGTFTSRSKDKPMVKLNLGLEAKLSALSDILDANNKTTVDYDVEYAFVYQDTDSFENEINELYSYKEAADYEANRLGFYTCMEREGYGDAWIGLESRVKKEFVELYLDSFENEDTLKRVTAGQSLLYLVQGVFGECSSTQQQIEMIHANAQLLYNANALPVLVQAMCGAAKSIAMATSHVASKTKSNEMKLYANTIYTIIVSMATNHRQLLTTELVSPIYSGQPLFMTLYRLIMDFSKPQANFYPIKKLILLLWKTLLYGYGTNADIQDIKKKAREKAGLRGYTIERRGDRVTKARPPDVMTFASTTSKKYYGYFKEDSSTTGQPTLPPPIKEGMLVLNNSIYYSVCDYQYQSELAASYQCDRPRLTGEGDDNQEGIPIGYLGPNSTDGPITKKPIEVVGAYIPPRCTMNERSSLDILYELCLPTLDQFVILLLKIILAAVPDPKKTGSLKLLTNFLDDAVGSTPLSVLQAVQSSVDGSRHKEIIMKAVTAILLLLLKHFKANHVFQYEYLCQLIVKDNGLLLLLKIINRDIKNYVTVKNSVASSEFFNYTRTLSCHDVPMEPIVGISPSNEDGWFCWRIMFSLVNTLRLLHTITKANQPRLMLLVQLKAHTLLSKAVRLPCDVLQTYCLKILKGLLRYLPKKWRTCNMRLISGIYHRVRLTLADDWVGVMEVEMNFSQAE